MENGKSIYTIAVLIFSETYCRVFSSCKFSLMKYLKLFYEYEKIV